MDGKGLGRDVSSSISNAPFLMLGEYERDGLRTMSGLLVFSKEHPLLSGTGSWAKWSDAAGQRQMRHPDQIGD